MTINHINYYVITEHTPDSTSGYDWLIPGTPLLTAAVAAGRVVAQHGPDSRVRLVEVTLNEGDDPAAVFEGMDMEDQFDALPALWESDAAKTPLHITLDEVTTTGLGLLRRAAWLVDDGSNTEYTRGIVEFLADSNLILFTPDALTWVTKQDADWVKDEIKNLILTLDK